MGAHDHLYDLVRWKRLRLSQLRAHPLCERCLSRNTIRGAHVVHHRQPHRGDLRLFFDVDNLASSCADCHDVDESRIEHGGKARREPDESGWPV